ncbi:MAG TPA: hypothetical protein VF138_12445 [Caulobacteraceae bacterium]
MSREEQLKGINPDWPVESPREGLVRFDSLEGQIELRRRHEDDAALVEGLTPRAAAVAPLLLALARLAARQDAREAER